MEEEKKLIEDECIFEYMRICALNVLEEPIKVYC